MCKWCACMCFCCPWASAASKVAHAVIYALDSVHSYFYAFHGIACQIVVLLERLYCATIVYRLQANLAVSTPLVTANTCNIRDKVLCHELC